MSVRAEDPLYDITVLTDTTFFGILFLPVIITVARSFSYIPVISNSLCLRNLKL